jgi:ABC-type bacteriocin/lantibiotic exporter with double-glycine peptidase domain
MRLRFACVNAGGATDCGPAALATIALHYGLRVSVLHLHEAIGTSLQGSDLESLRSGAATLGFEAACGRLQPEALDKVALPLIAHLNRHPRGHYVVVHRVTPRIVVVADPAKGVLRLRRKEFGALWSRQVLLVRPSRLFGQRHRQESAWLDLIRIACSEDRFLVPATGLAVGGALLAYGMSFFVKFIVDRVIPNSDLTFLELLGIGISVVVLVRMAMGAARQYALAKVGMALSAKLGLDFTYRLLWLPLSFYEGQNSGDILARFLDASKIAAAITGALLSVVLDLTLLAACGVFMASSSWQLTVITLCFLPIVLAVTLCFMPRARRLEREMYDRFSRLTGRFFEVIANIRTVKAYTAERQTYDRLAEVFFSMQQSGFERASLGVLTSAVSSLVTGMASVCLLWRGAQLSVAHQLSVGELMFFYSVLLMFLGSVDRLGPSVVSIQDAVASIDRIREVNTLRLENCGPLLAPGGRVERIQFEDVSFWYRQRQPVIEGLTLAIHVGETVAILGETGSGKSTLMSLIIGLYTPKRGQVLIDGRTPIDLDLSALRRRIALVMQEPGLLSGTIRDNIAVGSESASPSDIVHAARIAQAHDFIMTLPGGYDYEVGAGGGGLSAGQRQRIVIARALVRRPSVLLLDEATSNLDPETEGAVFSGMQAQDDRGDRITIIATHRLTVASRADRIVVLQSGRLVESGNHDSLLSLGGRYAGMWRAFVQNSKPRGQSASDLAHRTPSYMPGRTSVGKPPVTLSFQKSSDRPKGSRAT